MSNRAETALLAAESERRPVLKEGLLETWNVATSKWLKCYAIIRGDVMCIYENRQRRSSELLSAFRIGVDDSWRREKKNSTFSLSLVGLCDRTGMVMFRCDKHDELLEWLASMETLIKRHVPGGELAVSAAFRGHLSACLSVMEEDDRSESEESAADEPDRAAAAVPTRAKWFFPNCDRQLAERVLAAGRHLGHMLMRHGTLSAADGSFCVSALLPPDDPAATFRHFLVVPTLTGFQVMLNPPFAPCDSLDMAMRLLSAYFEAVPFSTNDVDAILDGERTPVEPNAPDGLSFAQLAVRSTQSDSDEDWPEPPSLPPAWPAGAAAAVAKPRANATAQLLASTAWLPSVPAAPPAPGPAAPPAHAPAAPPTADFRSRSKPVAADRKPPLPGLNTSSGNSTITFRRFAAAQ